MAKRFRVKKIVNWKVQGPFIWRLLFHFFAYNAAVLTLLLAAWGIQSAVNAVTDVPAQPRIMTLEDRIAPLAIAMLVMTPFMIWDLMRITNRVAGPLYRFEQLMNDFVRTGKLGHAKLREGDLPTDFRRRFNEFTDALHALYPETAPERPLPPARKETAPQSLDSANAASPASAAAAATHSV